MMAAAAAWLFYQSRIAVVILSPFAFPYCLYRLKGEREKKMNTENMLRSQGN